MTETTAPLGKMSRKKFVLFGSGTAAGYAASKIFDVGQGVMFPQIDISTPKGEEVASVENLDLAIPQGKAMVHGWSGYDEIWDQNGRVRSRGGTDRALYGSGINKDGQEAQGLLLTEPMIDALGVRQMKLSPDGKSMLAQNQRGSMAVAGMYIDNAQDTFGGNTGETYYIRRLGGNSEGISVIRLPQASKAAFDERGRFFVLTKGEVHNIGTIELGGQGRYIDLPRIETRPFIRVYKAYKDQPDGYPLYEEDLDFTFPQTAANLSWANFVSGGVVDTLDEIMSQQADRDFAISPDASWLAIPTNETFFWRENEEVRGQQANSVILTSVEYDTEGRQGMFIDRDHFVRISSLEYRDLNGEATQVDTLGFTQDGKSVVVFSKGLENKDSNLKKSAVIGLVEPNKDGTYKIWYVNVPAPIYEVKRQLEGIYINLVDTQEQYLNAPFLSDDQLSQLAQHEPWYVYNVEGEVLVKDETKSSYSGPQQKITPWKKNPEPIRPPDMQG